MSWSPTLHSFPLCCSHPDLVDPSLSLSPPDQPHDIPSSSAVCDLSDLPTLLPSHPVSRYLDKFLSLQSIYTSIRSVNVLAFSLYTSLTIRHLQLQRDRASACSLSGILSSLPSLIPRLDLHLSKYTFSFR